jgi:hypothetical protein
MYQQLWGYKFEEKLYLGVGEQKRLNTTGLGHISQLDPTDTDHFSILHIYVL